jgi:hypothetical protein
MLMNMFPLCALSEDTEGIKIPELKKQGELALEKSGRNFLLE